MVEFRLGRNIKAKQDKLLIAATGADLVQMLNAEENTVIGAAVRAQTPYDAIKAYDLGKYTLFAGRAVGEWRQLGGAAYHKIKACRQVKVQIAGATAQNLADFALGMELAAYRFDKYSPPVSVDLFPQLESVVFTGSGLKNLDAFKPNIAVATAVRYARDLLNEPAEVLTAAEMAADLQRLDYLGLEIEIPVGQREFAVLQWRGRTDTAITDLGLVGGAEIAAVMKATALQKVAKNVVAVVDLARKMVANDKYLRFLQEHWQPRLLVDVVTMDTAAVEAVMTANDEKWAQIIAAAGAKTGEKVRQVPAVTAPQEVSVPWVHLDIAGVADGSNVLYPPGASGLGVQLLAEVVQRI